MTIRISDDNINVPPAVARSYRSLSSETQKMILDELYETILDCNAAEEAKKYNSKNPKTYTLDEIRKELDLA